MSWPDKNFASHDEDCTKHTSDNEVSRQHICLRREHSLWSRFVVAEFGVILGKKRHGIELIRKLDMLPLLSIAMVRVEKSEDVLMLGTYANVTNVSWWKIMTDIYPKNDTTLS